jgi:hypothetical protein
MELNGEQRDALGVALNEATLLGFEVDSTRRVGVATFKVLTLPEKGPPPQDCRVQFLFLPVGRVAASLRKGTWDNVDAEVVPFSVDQLLEIVSSFGGLPIYGWEFFDVDEAQLAYWGSRFSLDWRSGEDGVSHSIRVFQEDGFNRYLDLLVWFDSFEIRRADGIVVPIEDFVAGGKRWWDGLNSGDPRTQDAGIIPLKWNDV